MDSSRQECQICGRFHKIMKNGTLSHHGFQRPGNGWQSSSCYGAKKLPLNKTNKDLERYIAQAKFDLASMETKLSDPVLEFYFKPLYYKVSIRFTKENFEEEKKDFESKAIFEQVLNMKRNLGSWESIEEKVMKKRKSQIQGLKVEIEMMEKRFSDSFLRFSY